jgi:WD40 repeat protein
LYLCIIKSKEQFFKIIIQNQSFQKFNNQDQMKTFILLILAAWLPFASIEAQASQTFIPDANAQVKGLARNGNDLYLGGFFTAYNGTTKDYLVKLNATTGAVQSWSPNLNGAVHCMALSADGSTLFVGGDFTMVGGTGRRYLAAINTTTGAATSWNPNPNSPVLFMALATGNTVFITGNFATVDNADGTTEMRPNMAAINAAGNVTGFNPRPSGGSIREVAVSSDGNFFYIGMGNTGMDFTDDMMNTVHRRNFAALNASDGTPTSWNPHPNAGVFDIEVSGTTLYMAGAFTDFEMGTHNRQYMAKWNDVNTTPTLDVSFVPSIPSIVRAITLKDSKIYGVGESFRVGTALRAHFFALDATTGTALPDFNLGANDHFDETANKLASTSNQIYLYGAGTRKSVLGGTKRYFHCFDLTGNDIAAKAAIEVADAVGTVNYTLNSPQTTGMSLELVDPSSGGNNVREVFCDRYNTAPQNVSGVAEANVLPYRFMYQFTANANSKKLIFKLSDIPNHGLSNPANTKIYYRTPVAEGAFTNAGTVTYNAGAGTLSINVTSWFNVNEIVFATNDMIVLPVELLTFKGQNTEGGNLLAWQTAQEQNTQHFDIERSTDNRQFEKIGTVKTKGSNSNYQFLDAEANNSIAYYRLKINDFDGKNDYSKVIALQSKGKTKVEVYPTVTTGEVRIVGAKTFQIFNLAGQIVFEKKSVTIGESFIYLNDQAAGTYLVKGVDTEGGVFSQKIVKQ